MARTCTVPRRLQIVVDGGEGVGMQGDPPELLSLAEDVDDGLVPVGLEIPDLEAADFGLS